MGCIILLFWWNSCCSRMYSYSNIKNKLLSKILILCCVFETWNEIKLLNCRIVLSGSDLCAIGLKCSSAISNSVILPHSTSAQVVLYNILCQSDTNTFPTTNSLKQKCQVNVSKYKSCWQTCTIAPSFVFNICVWSFPPS